MSWNADQYKIGNTIQESLAMHMIESNFGTSFAGKEVLDLGCGTGNITSKLICQFGAQRVHGIDLSVSMINYCHNNYNDQNLTFSLGDIKDLKAEAEYDIVTSFFCLHWLNTDSKIQTFRAITHALRPGGVFLAAGGIKGDHQNKHPLIDVLQELLPELITKYPGLGNKTITELSGYQRLTRDDALKLLAENGLTVLHMDHITIPLKFDNTEELDKFVRPLISPIPLLKLVPPEDREEIINHLILKTYNSLKNGIYNFDTTVTKAIKS